MLDEGHPSSRDWFENWEKYRDSELWYARAASIYRGENDPEAWLISQARMAMWVYEVTEGRLERQGLWRAYGMSLDYVPLEKPQATTVGELAKKFGELWPPRTSPLELNKSIRYSMERDMPSPSEHYKNLFGIDVPDPDWY